MSRRQGNISNSTAFLNIVMFGEANTSFCYNRTCSLYVENAELKVKRKGTNVLC